MRTIKISYDAVTPESAKHGEHAETGWLDVFGENMEPDECDREDGITPVTLAVKFLRDNGPMEASCHPSWSPGTWYSGPADTDYRTGAETAKSFHLDGFDDSEQEEIYNQVTGRKAVKQCG